MKEFYLEIYFQSFLIESITKEINGEPLQKGVSFLFFFVKEYLLFSKVFKYLSYDFINFISLSRERGIKTKVLIYKNA